VSERVTECATEPVTEPGTEPMLKVIGVSKEFGGLRALRDVSFEVMPGETLALIGPNGAGKSTLFNILTGFHRPTSGRVLFSGKDLTEMRTFEISRAGVGRTFQKIRLFKGLTVLENVRLAVRVPVGGADVLFRTARFRSAEERAVAEARGLLELVGLSERAEDKASSLPYGQQRLLEIARALAGRPRLLLLDEPGAGMNSEELASLHRLLSRIRAEFRLTMVLVEHNVDFVLGLSDRIVVLDHGEVIAVGTPAEVVNNPAVIAAYLGRPRQ